MKQYHDLARLILEKGTKKEDRTGTGTISYFGAQMRFDLNEGFPLVTTKKCHIRSIIHELLWFLNGDTNIKYLNDNGVTIWDEWALKEDQTFPRHLTPPDMVNYAIANKLYKGSYQELVSYLNSKDLPTGIAYLEKLGVPLTINEIIREKGDLGPVYGKQWRSWPVQDGQSIDQISEAINLLRTDPDSRRIIVSSWNVGELSKMALQPCHALFQFYAAEVDFVTRHTYFMDLVAHDSDLNKEFQSKCYPIVNETDYTESVTELMNKYCVPTRRLSCQLYQRSCDVFLGLPFNIASYALLTCMFAQQCNMLVGEFVWTGGDIHIYNNHIDQINLLLSREPRQLPRLDIDRLPESIFDYKFEDFKISEYDPHPAIKAPVAV